MYNIKSRFEKIAANHPLYSTYTAFAEAIKNTSISERTVRLWFYRLVDSEDYQKSDGPAIVRHLVSITKPGLQKTCPETV
jgi:hypothetical protein